MRISVGVDFSYEVNGNARDKTSDIATDRQYTDAKRALDIIEQHVLPKGRYLTYGRLAKLLGYEPDRHSRHIGQVRIVKIEPSLFGWFVMWTGVCHLRGDGELQ
jgi:alkylated DNA nucleotide flippase Atl1